MPINYSEISSQVRSMGMDAKAHQSEIDARLVKARILLESVNTEIIMLQRKVEEAAVKNKRLRCAVPVDESLTAHVISTLPPPACTILSADGSQINPDPHDSVLYGLVNIGVFILQCGSRKAPRELSYSDLLYGDALQTNSGLATEELIALLRDVREREVLAMLAKEEAAPVITLTDGPLELYHEPQQEKQYKPIFDNYLKALDDLAIARIITAGYVSRPRADLVVSLLALINPDSADETASRPFAGITDITLLGDRLAAGERSAIFRLQSNSSSSFEGPKSLHFFYLNVGTPTRSSFARVEIPLWVVENPSAVELLHAVLLDQSRQAGGIPYPYPLIRAHEIAVVKMIDRQQLTSMIETELLRQGFQPGRKSEKQSHKDHQGRTRLIK